MPTWDGKSLNKFYIAILNALAVGVLAVSDDNVIDGNDWGIIAAGVVNAILTLLVRNTEERLPNHIR